MSANDPAFPVGIERPAPMGGIVMHPGLTKREWFAGMALASFNSPYRSPAEDAKKAYAIADAMIAAGEGEQ